MSCKHIVFYYILNGLFLFARCVFPPDKFAAPPSKTDQINPSPSRGFCRFISGVTGSQKLVKKPTDEANTF